MLNNTINKLKNLIEKSENKPEYQRGLKDALKIVEDNIFDNLIVGAWYYILMDEEVNGSAARYIEKMRLFKTNGNSYFFTKDVKFTNKADLVLRGTYSVKKRVYINEELAKKHMHTYKNLKNKNSD